MCISWTIKCVILLMHGEPRSSRTISLIYDLAFCPRGSFILLVPFCQQTAIIYPHSVQKLVVIMKTVNCEEGREYLNIFGWPRGFGLCHGSSRSPHRRDLWWRVALAQVYLRGLWVSPISILPSKLLTLLHFNYTFSRRANGWKAGAVKQNNARSCTREH